jgi:pyrroline-5-carboxylate reductase
MSGYTKFAVVGAGNIGNFIIQQLLKDKAAGTIKEVVVLTRQVKSHPSKVILRDVLTIRPSSEELLDDPR